MIKKKIKTVHFPFKIFPIFYIRKYLADLNTCSNLQTIQPSSEILYI